MKSVRLVNLDHPTVENLITDPVAFEKQHGARLNGTEKTVRFIALSTREILRSRKMDPRWWCYLGIDETTGEVIGTCAFRGEPKDGAVEIGYLTFQQYLGEGYAVAMANLLLEVASRSGRVRTVVAHTLPKPNASSWILQRIGMRFVGKEMDPADGWVWRWEKEVAAPDAGSDFSAQAGSGI